ncbi:MFS transporter [Kocuria dechangensis]|uniref:MFS transporter n=1 Tax=Kocuria dechangensis TaxID=1176249 RepID=A0A917H457_9MICC|nr:YbfB/YjiJ family MFS transporter [Kocuria dechangensis]GGG67028.1 MFS transporter [Kocuria dechangensis]
MLQKTPSVWAVVVPGAAAMALAMGVGRFGFTPILPLMQDQAGLAPEQGAQLATANYLGYLLGAVLALVRPAVTSSVPAFRAGLVVQVASLAAMATTASVPAWAVARVCSGVASAVVFIAVAGVVAAHVSQGGARSGGWVYGGIGGGIVLSGVLVLALEGAGTWSTAWWACAGTAAVLCAAAWILPVGRSPAPVPAAAPAPGAGAPVGSRPGVRRSFVALVVSYFLEGAGYIIAGTFLVAAIRATSPGWIGSSAWVVVGLAALPSSALYARLASSFPPATVLRTALLVQAAGMLLPAVFSGSGVALLAGVVFGGTFLGIVSLGMGTGARMGVPRSAAILTIAFSIGQILGPLAAAPLLGRGYAPALVLGAVIVTVAAIPTLLIRSDRHAAG